MYKSYLMKHHRFGVILAILICCFTINGFCQVPNKTVYWDSILHPLQQPLGTDGVFDSIQINIFFKTHSAMKKYANQTWAFYRKRKYAYAWFKNDQLIAQATNLANRMLDLTSDGVFVQLPCHQEFDSLLQKANIKAIKNQWSLTLELMLTTQYFIFSKIVWEGMSPSVSTFAKWHLPRKQVAYNNYLEDILNSPLGQLPSNEPVYRQYELLRSFLIAYRAWDVKEKWLPIPAIKHSLKPGDTSLVISLIKTRLYKLGDYTGDTINHHFTISLLNSIAQFQQRHGLKVDSLPNKETIEALNVPLKSRIKQILVNMERCRWLPAFVNTDYVAVNIPEFKLHVYHGDSLLWNCNVVVGKTARPTSIFYDE